ncbi:hypothetical protein NP233_g572 [Leucocoprinus birnbaumii]|uniref:Uncharacterized protein n=1 Tax=Leucocoprinus birnbaumii TaxID=56174 RepID=A0AAD5YVN7_9AGAR|nr:hypothetical protein NP233_g572 [Leucocoprinus birnbaumii]
MVELKLEQEERASFENEAQVFITRPRRSKHRCARIIIFLSLGFLLAFFQLDRNMEYKPWAGTRHGYHRHGHKAEKAFLSVPDAGSAIKVSRQYTNQPHVAGTDGDFRTAELFLSNLQQSFGITPPETTPVFDAGSAESQDATRGIVERDAPSAWIDKYYPVMNTPLDRTLQIVDHDGSVLWEADLKEEAPEGDDKDQDAAKYADAVPTFHGFSISGDVTGHLIDGNYCSKEVSDLLNLPENAVYRIREQDYDKLVTDEASLEGSIVLCRYGGITRGLKVQGAQENGVVGVLIYSDPRDDGFIVVENGYAQYPDGPARNPTSVQRGSVQLVQIYPGDPTTPGYPSYENATRTEGTNLPSIPSLPISWNNAKQLLQVLQTDNPLHGKQMQNGWKPLRTIVIASWDAEEYGLIGSTEWGEDFADWIDKHVVAYLNLDSAVAGSKFESAGSPLLAHFIRETAQEIPHPTDANRTLWDASNDDGPLLNSTSPVNVANTVRVAQTGLGVAATVRTDDLGVSLLGTGSDFTVFLQRNGIPCTDEGFNPGPHDPVYHYHSVYDSEHWLEKYGDPGFARHIAIAKHFGLQTMRMADTLILPLNTTHYAIQLEEYLDKIENLPETQALDLDLGNVRQAMQKVWLASRKLDGEKWRAEQQLRRLVLRWRRHHRRHMHGLHPQNPSRLSIFRALLHRIKVWILDDRLRQDHTVGLSAPTSILTQSCPGQTLEADCRGHDCYSSESSLQRHFNYSRRLYESMSRIYTELDSDAAHEDLDHPDHDHEYHHGHQGGHHKRWRETLIRTTHRVREINDKLRSFERGFISEDGIKDREWFKHLGVAPGRWLGYGATPLPGLAEAITFDQDKVAAEHEAQRLINLLENIATQLNA